MSPEHSTLSPPGPHLRTHRLVYLESIVLVQFPCIGTWQFAQGSDIVLSQSYKRTVIPEGPFGNT